MTSTSVSKACEVFLGTSGQEGQGIVLYIHVSIMCACILNIIVKKFTGCACTVLVLGLFIVVYLQYSYYMYNIYN